MKYHRFVPILVILSLLFSLMTFSVFAEPTEEITAEDTAEMEDVAADPDASVEAAAESKAETTSDSTGHTSDTATFDAIDDFSVDGTSALLYEMNSGTILYAQDINDRVYPASLTKILTCLLALENGSLTDMVTVSEEAISAVAADARTNTVLAGETIALEDLLYYVMLSSSNEACNVVAEYVAGSIEEFVVMMNERAAEIGCTGTHFANPHGLHDDNHYTTANDLMLITLEALRNSTFEKICTTTEYEIPATNLQSARTIHTTNYLTSTTQSYRYYYSLAKGVKTGYTGMAGRCLISTAESNDLHLLSIVTGCSTTPDGNSGEYILNNFTETVNLFEYGFEHFEFATVLSSAVPIAEVPVENGSQSSVVIAPASDTSVILPSGYDSDKITTEITLYGGNSIQAPVESSDVVGVISVYYDGELISKSDITPITDVSAGNAVYYSEEELAASQKNASENKLSVWKFMLILLVLCVALYVSYYVYRNMTRKKRRRKRKKAVQKKAVRK